MAYSGVYVFGDSLVDAVNALKLAETYDYFPFASLPNGADRIIYDPWSGNLYFDPDGNGGTAQTLFATMGKSLKLTAAEFVII